MAETLIQKLENTVRRYGSKPALSHKHQGRYRAISYDELYARVRKFCLGLHSLGVRPKDKVALLAENRPEWAISDLGVLSLGAITVPIYPTLSPVQVAYIADDSDARLMILSTKKLYEQTIQARKQMRQVKTFIVMDALTDEEKGPELLDFTDVIRRGEQIERGEEIYRKCADSIRPEDLATIIYTSGTTGDPRGAMLTHGNFTSNVEGAQQRLPVDSEDLFLSFLPLSHVFERMAGYYFPISLGATIAYAESPFTVAQNMAEVRPTVMASVPRLYELMHMRIIRTVESSSRLKRSLFYWGAGVGQKVSQHLQRKEAVKGILALQSRIVNKLVFEKLQESTGGRLRFFVSGGAPLPQAIAEFFHAAGILILEGYGLTETSPVISCNTPDENKFGTVGKPLPNVEVRIAEDGEILTRGPHVMQGYYKKPKDTAEAIDVDGWFHTGDIGLLDDDGFLKITDRKKNIIVLSNGKNVAPQPIENKLKQSRYINQVMLVGDGRKTITALIVPDFDAIRDFATHMQLPTEPLSDLLQHPTVRHLFRDEIDDRMASFADFEQVKMFTLLEREFSMEEDELTPTLKMRRKVILEKYRDEIERMYGVVS